VTTALLVLVAGITFIPDVTDISYDLVGLGPTLWRVSWLATTAALVGVAGTALSQRGVAAPTVLKYLVPIALAAIIVVAGTPIWSAEAGVSFKKPWEWQRSAPSLAAAKQVIAAADDGDVVLAPQDLAITLDVMTTRVKTVAPRDYFMDYLRDEPGFDFDDRLTLVEFVNLPPGDPFDEAGVRLALDRLQIDSICLPTGSEQRVMFLEGTGYIPGVATASYGCLDRLAS
jgi:hypothetical protein